MNPGNGAGKKESYVESCLYLWKNGQMENGDVETRLGRVIAVSKEAFWEGEFGGILSRAEFLLWQSSYIKKRWWVLQLVVLSALWGNLCLTESQWYVRRSMGALAPVFILLLVPELWKNRVNGSIEIEGASCFNLRQVYAARMAAFGLVDVCMLSIFGGAAVLGGYIALQDMLIHFFVPIAVAACICFRTLCSRFCGTPYIAAGLTLFWIAVWLLIVQDGALYERISVPVWSGLLGILMLYLCMTFIRIWSRAESCPLDAMCN